MLAVLLSLPAPAVAQGDNIYITNLKGVQDKIVQLAQAMPEATYGWRPEEGVRSVSEVYMHMASGNYGYGRRIGVESPADRNQWEKTVTGKAEVIAKLKASYDAIITALEKADFSKPEVLATAMNAISHGHEHLGQSIAYARMNKVVPPWSR